MNVGRFTRWRLCEPVRLYLYAALTASLLVACLGGLLDGQLFGWVCAWVAFALPMTAGAEAARASVYSAAGLAAELRGLRDGARADLRALLEDEREAA